MYRTILLAYDGTRQGREALDQGAELARLCQARVYLFAVVAHDLGVTLAEAAAPSDLPEREYQEVRQILVKAAEILLASGLPVESRLAVGNPAEEIGRLARKVGAELIVVGHREQSTFARWWGGSTGASLLAHAPCSLLITVPGAPPIDRNGGGE